MTELVCELERHLPQRIFVGKGNLLFVRGRCYHREEVLKGLDVVIDGVAHAVDAHSIATPEVLDGNIAIDDKGHVLTSTFWAMVPILPVTGQHDVDVAIRARLASSRTEELRLGTVRLVDGLRDGSDAPTIDRANVAICIVVSQPRLEALRSTLDSFARQTHTDWRCVLVDDASPMPTHDALVNLAHDRRIRVVRTPTRLGPFASSELALASVEGRSDFTVLADPYEPWPSDLLERAITDIDRVGAQGMVIPQARSGAPTEATELEGSALATLLGRSALPGLAIARSEVLDVVLPFPPDAGIADARLWVATAAATRGAVLVQQDDEQTGRQQNIRGPIRDLVRGGPTAVRRALATAARESSTEVSVALVQSALTARTLQLRDREPDPRTARTLEAFATCDPSMMSIYRWRRRGRGSRRATERSPMLALLLLWFLTVWFKRRRARLMQGRVDESTEAADRYERYIDKIEHDLTPLRLAVSVNTPARINVVVPMIDFRYVFGGYLMMFRLALALRDHGFRVRMLVVQEPPRDRARWPYELRKYPGLESFIDDVEVEQATDRTAEVEVSPRDVFLATTSWSAHVAHQASTQLGHARFPFLVLEYDPFLYPMSSLYELSARAYTFPHDAIFSTELLRKYFKASGLGVYANGDAEGDEHSVAVDNPVDVHRVSAIDLRNRVDRGLLFYARLEEHAQRNLWELGTLALRRLVSNRTRDLTGWRIDGIGSLHPLKVSLGSGRVLDVLPRVPLESYRETFDRYDVGLALQATPHPGLVALDMAAAGLVTVTNTWATKSADDLHTISPNLVAAEPTVEGISRALEQALEMSTSFEDRERGADLHWPRTWDEALDPGTFERIVGLPAFQLG